MKMHSFVAVSTFAGTLLVLVTALTTEGQTIEAVTRARPVAATPHDPAMAALIGQLGDASYKLREQATANLEAIGKPALPAVSAARRVATDPEIGARLARIETAITRGGLWNGTETVAQYARRMDVLEKRTVNLAETPAKVELSLTLIPAGEFIMGSPETEAERLPWETQHRVRISKPFLMQTTPVTQAQWRALMLVNPARFQGGTLPVDSVTWNDAVKFCQALSAHDGKACRLPTEAEWEFACRAGTTTAFSFGDAISPDTDANFNGNVHYGADGATFRVTTTPVGTFRPNPWGLYDMHGNVWQWCGDWYADYPAGDTIDPTGPAQGAARVVRGGSWADVPRFLRSACRETTPPDQARIHIGFRVVQELP